jgi:hypothetical protein
MLNGDNEWNQFCTMYVIRVGIVLIDTTRFVIRQILPKISMVQHVCQVVHWTNAMSRLADICFFTELG